jgi:nitrite reductase (NADH) small subunit
MSEFVRLAAITELPAANEAKEFQCGDRMVCVANLDGQYYAIDNECAHNGGPLGQGVVFNGRVVCPWHAWSFDLKTGEIAPGRPGVPSYELKIDGSEVLVKMS